MIWRPVLIFVGALCSGLILFVVLSKTLSAFYIPYFMKIIGVFADAYLPQHLRLMTRSPEDILLLTVTTITPITTPKGVIPAGTSFVASTVLPHLSQSLVLFVAVMVTGMFMFRCGKILTLILSVPVGIALPCLDIPFVLMGALDDLLFAQFDGQDAPWRASVAWMNFMLNGGRFGLGIVGALLALAVGEHLFRRMSKISPKLFH